MFSQWMITRNHFGSRSEKKKMFLHQLGEKLSGLWVTFSRAKQVVRQRRRQRWDGFQKKNMDMEKIFLPRIVENLKAYIANQTPTKNIFNRKWNTPLEFKQMVFSGEAKKNRCDRIMFVIGTKPKLKRAFQPVEIERTIVDSTGMEVITTDSEDENSIESFYLGHSVRCTTCYISCRFVCRQSASLLYKRIMEMLPNVYPPFTRTSSLPILVMEDVVTNQGCIVVDAFYLWEELS